MSRRGRTAGRVGTVLSLLVMLLSGCARPTAFSARNLVLISVDSLRADRLGCWGDPEARTPFWDRLARQGAQFRTAITSAPVTVPSHATLLSGHHPFAHRARTNDPGQFAPPGPTLAEALSRAGLATAAFTGTAVLDASTGLGRGFGIFEWQDRAGQPERTAASVIGAALAWIDGLPADSPFFLFVHLRDPHEPHEPVAEWKDRLGDPYREEIAAADRGLLLLLRGLEARDRTPRTAVIATSGHGEALGEHDETGHGRFLYEATIRVPLVIWGPLPYRGGTIRSGLARGIDVAPTALSALRVGPDWRLRGRSLAKRLKPYKQAALLAYTETFGPEGDLSEHRAIRVGEWKYVRGPQEELYDLSRDPGERENRFGAEPERAGELRARMLELIGDDPLTADGLASGGASR